jgi:triosephosphate isomerase
MRALIVGNWKMHKGPAESVAFIRTLLEGVGPDDPACDMAVAPGFLALREAGALLKGSRVALAAQDTHWEEEGPFTGEVPAGGLREAGCRYVIVGHSERRHHFGESDRAVNRKVRAVLQAGMTPVVCVGEQASERDEGRAHEVVESQVRLALANIRMDEGAGLAVAYEPVWAIGTGRNATPGEAAAMHARIRAILDESFGSARAAGMRVIYGGSVSPSNAGELLGSPAIDGALVGGASLQKEAFLAICRGAGR